MPQIVFFPFILEVLILVRARFTASGFACSLAHLLVYSIRNSCIMYFLFCSFYQFLCVYLCAGFNGEKLFTDYLHRRSTLHRVYGTVKCRTVWIWYINVYSLTVYKHVHLFGRSTGGFRHITQIIGFSLLQTKLLLYNINKFIRYFDGLHDIHTRISTKGLASAKLKMLQQRTKLSREARSMCRGVTHSRSRRWDEI